MRIKEVYEQIKSNPFVVPDVIIDEEPQTEEEYAYAAIVEAALGRFEKAGEYLLKVKNPELWRKAYSWLLFYEALDDLAKLYKPSVGEIKEFMGIAEAPLYLIYNAYLYLSARKPHRGVPLMKWSAHRGRCDAIERDSDFGRALYVLCSRQCINISYDSAYGAVAGLYCAALMRNRRAIQEAVSAAEEADVAFYESRKRRERVHGFYVQLVHGRLVSAPRPVQSVQYALRIGSAHLLYYHLAAKYAKQLAELFAQKPLGKYGAKLLWEYATTSDLDALRHVLIYFL